MLPPGGTAGREAGAPRIASGAGKRTAVRVAITLPSALWSAGSLADLSVHQAVLLNLTSMASEPQVAGEGSNFRRLLLAALTLGGQRPRPGSANLRSLLAP